MNKEIIGVAGGVIYNNDGKLLIARRYQPEDEEYHNKWEMVGGGIEFNETPDQAIIREVKEETGYDVEIQQLLPKAYTYTRAYSDTIVKMYFYIYICKIVGGEQNTDDPEIGELKFVDPSTLDDYDWVPIAKEAMQLAESLKS